METADPRSMHTRAVALGMTRALSPTQRALLTSQVLHPDLVAQNMALLVQFDEPIEIDRLIAAFDQVVDASDVLRTRIPSGDRTRAVVAGGPTSPTSIDEVPRRQALRWAHDVAGRNFDLATSCYRSAIARHEDDRTSWVLSVHHIATDATTAARLIDLTIGAYQGVGPPESRFYDWVEQIEAERDPGGRTSRYWAGRAPVERTGRLYGSSDRRHRTATRVPVDLDALRERLDSRLDNEYRMLGEELAWAALLVTATAIYQHRLTGATDLTIGMPVQHRRGDAVALIGPVMGVYPVDVRIDPTASHRELHQTVARAVMTTIRNADPAIAAPTGCDAVVNVISAARPDRTDYGLTNRWLHVGEIDPEHLLRVQLTSFGLADDVVEQPQLLLDIQDRVGPPGDVTRAADHFRSVLEALVDDPDGPIDTGMLCTPDEVRGLLVASVAPDLPADDRSITDQLRTRLDGDQKIAVVAGDEALTGDELWRWASALASDIATTTPDRARIGVALSPSVEAVVAIYATLIAGRSFVPLDPAQPETRRRSLAERAGLARLVRTRDEVRRFRSIAPHEHDSPEHDSLEPRDDDREAYLLFTSGSTGEPKGVPITLLGLARYLQFATSSYFDDVEQPIAPLFTALTFDLTITTLFAPILRGGQLRIIEATGPAALVDVAATTDVNWCKATPSHLEVLVPMLGPDHALNTLVVGGEAFGAELARRLFEFNPDMAIFNEYGPTEAVVGCMIHRVDPARLDGSPGVPIGRPAPGVELRVVDGGDRRVPVGAVGELLIAHPGLTPGYLPGSAERAGDRSPFVELDGTRFYRSGDLVTYDEHHELTYLGRSDEQVKVGGVRLDPLEVERALVGHPGVARAAVRLWSPSDTPARLRCARCGLPDNVPGVTYDADMVCSTCHAFDRVATVADSWFRTEDDLARELAGHARRSTGEYDCMHLLSGGKDSTFALYRLVELGLRPYTLTLDNGYISEGAKQNARLVTEHLGLDHEFATTPHMDEIFRDSLATYSDVCHGCYKTIYTLATNRAVELGIPAIVTGLSRGQLFETRLIPGQFQADRFDGDAIDRAVIEARKRYHRAPDLPNRVLDTEVFATDDVFDDVGYVDFYRYVDVELSDVLDFLTTKTPWERPIDTGRSSNCLINVVGIRAHQIERGYHNYAEPYAWDVRLGHKQRDEAVAELDDPVDPDEIESILGDLGYQPKARSVLTAWVEVAEHVERTPTPTELRQFLTERLPSFAVPAAFVTVAQLPVNPNGKLETRALPAPDRRHRAAVGAHIEPESALESTIISIWESILGIEPIGPEDDFFALGGDSLDAVTMIVELGDVLGTTVREELAFVNTTVRLLAASLTGSLPGTEPEDAPTPRRDGPIRRPHGDEPPQLSAGEQSILVHQRTRPDDVMYNVGRVFTVPGPIEIESMRAAVTAAVDQHEPLTWTFGSPRRRLDLAEAVEFVEVDEPLGAGPLDVALSEIHRRPFDLEHGPLLRCGVFPTTTGDTAVCFALHHVSGDHSSLDALWSDVDHHYSGRPTAEIPVGFSDFCSWQTASWHDQREFWSRRPAFAAAPDFLATSSVAQPDGYLTTTSMLSPDELRTTASRTPVAAALAAAAAAVSPFFTGSAELNLVASTRDHPDAERLVGYLLNPIPLTLDIRSDHGLGEIADEASRTVGQVLPHRSYPFARIVADARSDGRDVPMGSVLVSYVDDPPASLDGRPVEQHMLWNGHAVADVAFFVEPRDGRVDLGLEYSGAAVAPEVAERLLHAFDAALTAIVHDPTTTVASVTAELIQLLPPPSLLDGPELADHELIATKIWKHLATGADAEAVQAADGPLTWAQVAARAGQIADELTSRGIGPGDRVAVRLSSSKQLPVAIIAIHAVGASYVPLDPTYPLDRSRSGIESAGARVELSDGSIDPLVERITIDDTGLDGTAWDDAHPAPAQPDLQPTDEAYVIFTSGSTGIPDGVPITHGQLAASTNARQVFYGHAPTRFLVPSSISFDSSLVGIFWTLATGGTLLLPDDRTVHDIDALVAMISASEPSHLLCVPTLYAALLGRKPPGSAWPQHVIVAGEACPASLVDEHHRQVPDSSLTNEYGPTEATVWATAHACIPGSTSVPIGRPIAGTWAAVVDDCGNIVPTGTPGELVIGGLGVAHGYLGDDTERRFVEAAALGDGFEAHAGRVFRTGDRVRADGDDLIFLGRLDDQLNVGGARVEPGEIESVLESIPDVTAAVVVATDIRPLDRLISDLPPDLVAQAIRDAASSDDPAGGLLTGLRRLGGRDRLVAHLVGPSSVDLADVRRIIAEQLPAAFRPAIYRLHADLPRLPNGKIDRAAAAILPVDQSAQDAAPIHDAESGPLADLCRMIGDVLLQDSVDPDDSFFDLGGDSLTALELIAQIEERYDVRLPTSAVHETPTAAGLAPRIGGRRVSDSVSTDDTLVVSIQPEGDRTPIFVLHNLGVNAEMWRSLSSRLGGTHPMTGLADPAGPLNPWMTDYDLEGSAEVGVVAERYASVIQRLHPDGPLVLMGFCLGGVVAFDVAQRLTSHGRSIEHVIVVNDWHAPYLEYRESFRNRLVAAQRAAERIDLRFLLSRVPGLGRYVWRRGRRAVERTMVRAIELARLPLPRRLQVRKQVETGRSVIHSYEFEPYNGNVTVIRSLGDPRIPAGAGRSGWGDLLDRLCVEYTPGNGPKLLEEPYVGTTAEIVGRTLDGSAEFRPSSDAP